MNDGYITTNQIIPNANPDLVAHDGEQIHPIVGFLVEACSGFGTALIMSPTGQTLKVTDVHTLRVMTRAEAEAAVARFLDED